MGAGEEGLARSTPEFSPPRAGQRREPGVAAGCRSRTCRPAARWLRSPPWMWPPHNDGQMALKAGAGSPARQLLWALTRRASALTGGWKRNHLQIEKKLLFLVKVTNSVFLNLLVTHLYVNLNVVCLIA